MATADDGDSDDDEGPLGCLRGAGVGPPGDRDKQDISTYVSCLVVLSGSSGEPLARPLGGPGALRKTQINRT